MTTLVRSSIYIKVVIGEFVDAMTLCVVLTVAGYSFFFNGAPIFPLQVFLHLEIYAILPCFNLCQDTVLP